MDEVTLEAHGNDDESAFSYLSGENCVKIENMQFACAFVQMKYDVNILIYSYTRLITNFKYFFVFEFYWSIVN